MKKTHMIGTILTSALLATACGGEWDETGKRA
jgi:hypothetical protein